MEVMGGRGGEHEREPALVMERRWRERCGRRSPQPPQPPASPAPLYARRSLSARCGRGALGAAAGAGEGREGKGCSGAGIGHRRSPGWAWRRGGAPAERGQRGPAGAPCAPFHSRCICARSAAPTAVHKASCPAECSELHLYVSWAVRAGVPVCEKTFCLANTDPTECISLYMQRMSFPQPLIEESYLLVCCAIYA